MKRYSPSATETWMTCPLKRHLSKGWQSRRIGKRELGAILGGAFAAGVSAWKTAEMLGQPLDAALYAEIAVGHARKELAALEQSGCAIGEYDRAQALALPGRAERAMHAIMAQDPIPKDWKVRDVERIFPEWGESRIDLGMDTPFGPVVVDWKTRLTHDAKWLPRDVERWRLSEQRFHYSCAYADFLHQPVYAFYILLVGLEPFRTHVIPFVNHPEELALWLQARQQTWADMEAEELGTRKIGMAAKHHDEYGPCEFTRACFEFLLDPHLMEHEFAPRAQKGTP